MSLQKKLSGSGFAPLQVTNIIGDVDPAVTALGTNAATAYPIGACNTNVTTAAAGTGVILPPGTTGAPNVNGLFDEYCVANQGTNPVLIYPPTGGTINGGASYSLAAGSLVYITCVSSAGLTWFIK
jgi:hypothetical protein